MTDITEKTLSQIEKIREKPVHTRNLFALVLAGGITFVLFLLWAFVLLPYRIDIVASKSNDQSKEASPFSVLRAQVGSAWDSITNTINNNKSLDWQNQYNRIKSETQQAGEMQPANQ